MSKYNSLESPKPSCPVPVRSNQLAPLDHDLIGAVTAMSDMVNDWAATTAAAAQAQVASSRTATIAIAAAGIAITMLLSVVISAQIRKTIGALSTSIGAPQSERSRKTLKKPRP